jgi:hypothetical protein
MWSFRFVVGCCVVCLLAAFQLQAQKATCTNWKTFVLNPANLNNPSEESDGVNDNHTVVGRRFTTSTNLTSRASCMAAKVEVMMVKRALAQQTLKGQILFVP